MGREANAIFFGAESVPEFSDICNWESLGESCWRCFTPVGIGGKPSL